MNLFLIDYSSSMKGLHKKNEEDIKITYVICLTILLYLFRTNIPFFKFPFLIFYSGLILYSIVYRLKQIPSTLKGLFRNFYLSILLGIILIVSFLLSNKLYLLIFKDVFNVIVLFSLFLFMAIYIKSKSDLDLFINNLLRFIILFSIIISVIFFCKFLNIFPGNKGISLNNSGWNSLVGPLSEDNNFALLPAFLGMIGVFYLLTESRTMFFKISLNLIIIIYPNRYSRKST